MSQIAPEQNCQNKEKGRDSSEKWAIKIPEVEATTALDHQTNTESSKILLESLAYAMLIPGFCVLVSSGFTVIPQHNVFDQPEYWYEISFPWTSLLAAVVILNVFRMNVFFKEVECLKSPKAHIKMFAILFLVANLGIYFTHAIWTDYLGCVFPVPFLYAIMFVFICPFLLFSIWFAFPSAFRNNPQTGRRIIWLIAYVVAFAVACYERLFAIIAFLHTPLHIQPIWAIILPAWREAELLLLKKISANVSDGDDRDGMLLTVLEQNCNYSAVLAICLGMYATDTSSYCILGVEFLLKIYTCYGIIKIDKKIRSAKGVEREKLLQQKQEEVQDLALDEFVEIIMPIVYVAMVLVAYYGPNGYILGNVGCEKWEWKKISDIVKFLKALFRMFIIDTLAFVATGFVFWKFIAINIFKQLCHDVKKYWPFISVVAGGAVTKVMLFP